jgi:glycosyltransferase involved in cell wall biosynthesis
MKVAVYTIALNEEHFVERWYYANKDADYLLIVDTGSTDKTVHKAKKFGIHVEQISIKPWRFDDARNAALALIPTDIDYCISVDMDEMLIKGWRAEMEKATTTRPRYTYTWSWESNGAPGVQFWGDHIHKRHGYRWKHPVHEVLTPDRIDETQEYLNLHIHHYPDQTKSRAQYLPLLAQSVLEDSNDDRNAYYYARELYFHNQYDLAIKEFERYLALPKATWKAERAAAMRHLGLMCTKTTEKKTWFLKSADEDPGRREPYVELARLGYLESDWESCYLYSQMALSIEDRKLEYLTEAWAWNEVPYDLAALASYKLGYKEKAIEYGTKACEINPNDERLKSNLGYYLS